MKKLRFLTVLTLVLVASLSFVIVSNADSIHDSRIIEGEEVQKFLEENNIQQEPGQDIKYLVDDTSSEVTMPQVEKSMGVMPASTPTYDLVLKHSGDACGLKVLFSDTFEGPGSHTFTVSEKLTTTASLSAGLEYDAVFAAVKAEAGIEIGKETTISRSYTTSAKENEIVQVSARTFYNMLNYDVYNSSGSKIGTVTVQNPIGYCFTRDVL